jgi:hypothetical protein
MFEVPAVPSYIKRRLQIWGATNRMLRLILGNRQKVRHNGEKNVYLGSHNSCVSNKKKILSGRRDTHHARKKWQFNIRGINIISESSGLVSRIRKVQGSNPGKAVIFNVLWSPLKTH